MLLFSFLTPWLSAEIIPQIKGVYFQFEFLPYGSGIMQSLYQNENGFSTVNTTLETNHYFDSANSSQLKTGFFYREFQAEIAYLLLTHQNNQFIDPLSRNAKTLMSSLNQFQLKAGKRFSIQGDNSYGFLYSQLTGLFYQQESVLTNPGGFYLGLGYEGFNSFGLENDWEVVFKYDINASMALYDSLSYNEKNNLKRSASLLVNDCLGAGFLYEPYHLSFLFIIRPSLNVLVFTPVDSDLSLNFSSSASVDVGLECRYTYYIKDFPWEVHHD